MKRSGNLLEVEFFNLFDPGLLQNFMKQRKTRQEKGQKVDNGFGLDLDRIHGEWKSALDKEQVYGRISLVK